MYGTTGQSSSSNEWRINSLLYQMYEESVLFNFLHGKILNAFCFRPPASYCLLLAFDLPRR